VSPDRESLPASALRGERQQGLNLIIVAVAMVVVAVLAGLVAEPRLTALFGAKPADPTPSRVSLAVAAACLVACVVALLNAFLLAWRGKSLNLEIPRGWNQPLLVIAAIGVGLLVGLTVFT
jgi:hypothetical protein